jgi:hypothetical protein
MTKLTKRQRDISCFSHILIASAWIAIAQTVTCIMPRASYWLSVSFSFHCTPFSIKQPELYSQYNSQRDPLKGKAVISFF